MMPIKLIQFSISDGIFSGASASLARIVHFDVRAVLAALVPLPSLIPEPPGFKHFQKNLTEPGPIAIQ